MTGSGVSTMAGPALVPMDAAARLLTLTATPLAYPAAVQTARTALAAAPALAAPSRRLSLASASDTAPVDSFNGRLEQPVLLARALPAGGGAPAMPAVGDPACLGAWDFALDMHTQRVIDTGPHGHHGKLVNTPTRAVCGARWTGQEHCFRHAPAHYGAIHFHDDDLDDCRWPATHAVTLPEGLKSDAYALLLQAGDAQENIPFFVVPPKGQATAKIAVLVSTYTYTVYGNHARPEWMNDPAWRAALVAQNQAWGAYPHNPGEHRDYDLSTVSVQPPHIAPQLKSTDN